MLQRRGLAKAAAHRLGLGDADTDAVITKGLLKWLWTISGVLLVGYAAIMRLLGADVSVLLVALYALVVPPMMFCAFLAFMGWLVIPVSCWWNVRTHRADWWEFREYLLSCPTPSTRLNQSLGWRRRGARTSIKAGSSLAEVAEALRPYYDKHPAPARRGGASTHSGPVPRSLVTALDWLRAGLDPTLLVACLRAQVSDERINAHRTGVDLLDEPAIRVLAALRA